jgi:hypothetical protein
MKTKFYWLALLASAAMIAQANAGGHHDGGGGFDGRFASAPRGGGGSSSHPAPMRNAGGDRMIYQSQRFSSAPLRSSAATAFRQYHSNASAVIGAHSFTAQSMNRSDRGTRFANERNRVLAGQRHDVRRQVRQTTNNLPSNWRAHVTAQHSANWHRDWDRRRDHIWHGHHCRFINGSWIIFDLGFEPWWPYWYPYDYYGYGYYYYPYGYTPGYYSSDVYEDEEYYGQNNYDANDEPAVSVVASAQEKLAQQGYYHGEIDGILGPQTRRAIARYQTDQGLRVTGVLTRDTVQTLGLQRVALLTRN